MYTVCLFCFVLFSAYMVNKIEYIRIWHRAALFPRRRKIPTATAEIWFFIAATNCEKLIDDFRSNSVNESTNKQTKTEIITSLAEINTQFPKHFKGIVTTAIRPLQHIYDYRSAAYKTVHLATLCSYTIQGGERTTVLFISYRIKKVARYFTR